MSKQKAQLMSVRILPNTTGNSPGKLADDRVILLRATSQELGPTGEAVIETVTQRLVQ